MMKWFAVVLVLSIYVGFAYGISISFQGTVDLEFLWDDARNWNPNQIPTQDDDVFLSGCATPPLLLRVSNISVCKSLTFINKGADSFSCPFRLVVSPSAVLRVVTTVDTSDNARIIMEGKDSLLQCSSMTLRGVIFGSGTVSCSQSISFVNTSSLVPGTTQSWSCSSCQDSRMSNTYGQLTFQCPNVVSRGSSFLFKALHTNLDISTSHDRIIFTGTLDTQRTQLIFFNTTDFPWNAPQFDFPLSPVIITYASLITSSSLAPFIIISSPPLFRNADSVLYLSPCAFCSSLTGCNQDNPTCTTTSLTPSSLPTSCTSLSSSSLSIVISTPSSSSAACNDFSSTQQNATLSATDTMPKWLLAVAIGVPCAVLVAVAVAITVVAAHNYKRKQYDKRVNAGLRADVDIPFHKL